MRKKSDEKKSKSCTLLKRPKIAFLGEQKSATKKAPPSNSPDLFGGGAFLVGILLIVTLADPKHGKY